MGTDVNFVDGETVIEAEWLNYVNDKVNREENAGSQPDTRYAHRVNNLSDLDNISSARDNLELGSASLVDIGIDPDEVPTNNNLGSAAYEDDTRYVFRSNNLSDLDDTSASRDNLGLGSAALADTGTGPDQLSDNQTLSTRRIDPVDQETGTVRRVVHVDGYLATEEV